MKGKILKECKVLGYWDPAIMSMCFFFVFGMPNRFYAELIIN